MLLQTLPKNNVCVLRNKTEFDIYNIMLCWLQRHFSKEFQYGGNIPQSQLNQFFSCRFSLKKEQTKDCLKILSQKYPKIVLYKRGIRILNGDHE